MIETIVCKFGGSSMTRPEDLEMIRRITNDDPRRRFVVVSAPGTTDYDGVKMTDRLIDLAETRDFSKISAIIARFEQLTGESIPGLRDALEERVMANLEECMLRDYVASFGEETCARITAQRLGAQFIDARELFLLTPEYGNAQVLPESMEIARKRLAETEGLCIIPGFYGSTPIGTTATFSRGGSDLTGSLVAAAVGAKEYENFTDKNGVKAADPNIIPEAKKIECMTFNELEDLAYSGFSIFHEEAVAPVKRARIPVHVRKTAAYPETGTYVVHDRLSNPDKPIIGVAYKKGFCSFDVMVPGLNKKKGIVRKILGILEDEGGISVEHFPSGIGDISFVFEQKYLKDQNHDVNRLTNLIYGVVGETADVVFQEHMGAVVVAGKGLKGNKGIAAKVQLTLLGENVNLRFISQGPSERCIVYGINQSDSQRAVRAIYDQHVK